jgi:F0F1-type ATP synthase membrane subunit c/vacuolar-type H+-ATPase subunit K
MPDLLKVSLWIGLAAVVVGLGLRNLVLATLAGATQRPIA